MVLQSVSSCILLFECKLTKNMILIDIANTFESIWTHTYIKCVQSKLWNVFWTLFIAERAAQWFVEGQTSGSL